MRAWVDLFVIIGYFIWLLLFGWLKCPRCGAWLPFLGNRQAWCCRECGVSIFSEQ